MPLISITDANNKVIYNDNGDLLVFDTDTDTQMWVPAYEINLINSEYTENPIGEAQDNDESEVEVDQDNNERLWSDNRILALIDLVKEYDKLFETTLKKNVWSRIAVDLNRMFQQKNEFTQKNVETKWKGLKRTYKSLKIKYNTSATCSSNSGLKCNINITESETRTETSESNCTDNDTENRPESSSGYNSSFSKKRKCVPNANDRHKEKMARQDKFLDLFQEMINKM
ncbi:hypothetical protein NQ314_019828 [Rhamnusium bicolor]|uniref:Myb/SANT-like DNA-binding domain-containing protein n=1 Tax=Rhamnusium bicolor TaxID=1586634 RepID=A0AAV8WND5_9CUCU|nr:hypothetical protein NQ314_019828 [Rhamnusium bicolor]